MKDADLKESLFKHYWAQGCFVQPEVDVHFQEGVDGVHKPITDIDILALRPHPDLYFERILGDCKTLRSMSPVARVLWLRGLMDFLGARTGCLLLGPSTRIEKDHKLTANRLGVNLLNQQDFKVYDRSVVYPNGSDKIIINLSDVNSLKKLPDRYPRLARLTVYLYRDAWRESGPAELIRHTLNALRQTRGEFDPAKHEQTALLCDTAAIFGIGLAEIAGRIFQQYLHPEDKNTLSESLKVILWGRRDMYNYYLILMKKIHQLQAGAEADEQVNLELPDWNSFVQLIRHILEYPAAAFSVPQLLRQMASDVLHKAPVLEDARQSDLLSLKLAMLTVSYLFKAGGMPNEFEKTVVGYLVGVQSRLVTDSRKQADKHQQADTPQAEKDRPEPQRD